jgi:hypothetical protein
VGEDEDGASIREEVPPLEATSSEDGNVVLQRPVRDSNMVMVGFL